MRESQPPKFTQADDTSTNTCGDQEYFVAWQQWLDKSIEHKVRTIHIEQEADCCRIRSRADGLLSEQRINNTEFAAGVKRFLEACLSQNIQMAGAEKTAACLIHRGVVCHINWHCYQTVSGNVIVIDIYNDRNIPDTLDQTSLDQSTILSVRQLLKQPEGGVVVISSNTEDLLCDVYYALLGELTAFDQKIISLESVNRKNVARINQIVSTKYPSIVASDASFVFVDWHNANDPKLINEILKNYSRTYVFTLAASLPSAIRQLTDIARHERRLATSLSSLVEIGRVRLVCPHCCTAIIPGKVESIVLSRCGITSNSSLNYGFGCQSCDFTGYGDSKILLALYEMNDLLRYQIESRRADEIRASLKSSLVKSIESQRNTLISNGLVEFKFTAAG